MNKTSVLAPLLLLTGCITTDVTRMSNTRYEPVSRDQVALYLYREDVPAQCEQVAMIEATGGMGSTSEAQMIRMGRKEAAKIGANAIVVDRIKEPSSGAQVAAAIFGVGTSRKGRIIALRCP